MKHKPLYLEPKTWFPVSFTVCFSRLLMALLVLLISAGNPVFSQQPEIIVTGKIVDEIGEPLPGVNITTTKYRVFGTITDMDGNFRLTVPADETLRVSFIGYKIQMIDISNRTQINISMETDVSALQEVVMIGYGSAKRANLVGSIATLDVQALEDFPVTNIISLLDGRMPGVHVRPHQPTGLPGAQTRIIIHGQNTFGQVAGHKESSPLFVVDGFIVDQNVFELLDPSEIESVSILKDAAAAVYGAAGSNGVVLVQTKRGRTERLRVNYSGSYGIGDATKMTPMLSAYDQARMVNARYSGVDPAFVPINEEELNYLRTVNHDWMDDAWKTSTISRHSINFSGGSDRVNYFFGGNHVYETGNFDNLDVTKYTYRLGLDADITKQLKASVSLSIGNVLRKHPTTDAGDTNTYQDLFASLLQTPKWVPNYINGFPTSTQYTTDNPFAFFETNSYRFNQDKSNSVNLNLTYRSTLIKGLESSVQYSRNEAHNYGKIYSIPYSLYAFEPELDNRFRFGEVPIMDIKKDSKDYLSESYRYTQYYQLNANISYARSFGLHSLKLLGSYEQTERNINNFGARAFTQVLSGVETQKGFNFTQAVSEGGMVEGGKSAGVGRLSYSYADKYIFEGTARIESSTLFHPDRRQGFFPGFGVGWIISEESFFRDNVGFLDFLKLRTAHGRTGLNSLPEYQYRLQYGQSGSYLFGEGSSGIDVQNFGVVPIGATWEKQLKTNVGLDIRTLRNRLSITLDGYYNYIYDILYGGTQLYPVTAGVAVMVHENLGRMESFGYDMEIGFSDRIGRDFNWFLKGIFGFYTNRVIYMPTDMIPLDFRYPKGKSTAAVTADQGYVIDGIIRTQAQLDAINAANIEQFGIPYTVFGQPAQIGMFHFRDIGRPGNSAAGEPRYVHEPDGRVDSYDIKYIQTVNDKMEWKNLLPTSASLGFNWKDLSVSAQFNMMYGTSSRLVDKLARTAPTVNTNAPAFLSDFFTEDNINATYPSPRWASMNTEHSTFWVEKEYLLRLRTLNVSYKLPDALLQQYGVSTMRVYFAGTNLWTPISTFDYKEDAISRFNTYPMLRTFSFGVNLTL